LAVGEDLLAQEDQLSVTESKSSPELSYQSSAFFKSSVESGCMARKVSAGSGSSFGMTLIYRGSILALQQALLKISPHATKSHFMFLPSLGQFMGNPCVLCAVGEFLLGIHCEQAIVVVPGGLLLPFPFEPNLQ